MGHFRAGHVDKPRGPVNSALSLQVTGRDLRCSTGRASAIEYLWAKDRDGDRRSAHVHLADRDRGTFRDPALVIVTFGEPIPLVGSWLARIPLFAIAALDSPRAFVLTFVTILIQNLQGYVISPVVEGDQLKIHPLLVFVAVLAGAALGGAIGAFVAVPAAAIVDLVVREVVVPWRRAQLRGPLHPADPRHMHRERLWPGKDSCHRSPSRRGQLDACIARSLLMGSETGALRRPFRSGGTLH